MPYTNYSTELQRVQYLSWVNIINMENLINQLESIQFALQTQRTQGLQLLSQVEKTRNFFGKSKRFPAENSAGDLLAFLCVDLKDWPAKFEQVMSALNYKVPDIAGTNKDLATNQKDFQSSGSSTSNHNRGNNGKGDASDDATKTITSMQERDRFEKAMKSFTTGLADFKVQLSMSIVTRDIFEEKYSLIWADKFE